MSASSFVFGSMGTMQEETRWSLRLGQWSRWLAYGLVFVVPLIYGPGGATPVAKMVAAHLLVELLALVVFLRFLERGGPSTFTLRVLRLTTIEWALLGFVAVLSLATLTSIDPVVSFWGTKGHGLGLVTYIHLIVGGLLVGRVLTSREDIHRLLVVTATGVGLAGLHAIIQYFGGDIPVYQQILTFNYGSGHRRAFATFGNPVHFTVYLALALPILAAWWQTLTDRGSRLWLGLAITLGVLATYASVAGHVGAQTLIIAAYTTLFLALAAWLWALTHVSLRYLKVMRLLSWLGLVFLIGTSLFVYRPELVRPLVPVLGRYVPQSEAFAARYPNWEMARLASRDAPWLGYGPDSYQLVSHQYYPARLAAFAPTESRTDRAHQVLLDWLIVAGWLGVIAFVLLLATVLARAWQIILSSTALVWQRLYAGGLVFALLAYLSQLWLNFPSHPDLLLFIIAIVILARITPGEEVPENLPKKLIDFRGDYWPIAMVAVIALLVLSWFTGTRFWLSELETKSGIAKIQQQQFDGGLADLRDAQARTRFVDGDLFLAEGYRRADKYTEAMDILTVGWEKHPAERRYAEALLQVGFAQAATDAAKLESLEPILKKFRNQTQDWTNVFLARIQMAAIRNNTTEAELVKQEVLQWAPNHFFNWDIEIGSAFASYHHPETAIAYLVPGLAQKPSITGWQALAQAYTEQRDFVAADKAYQSCLSMDTNQVNCWLGRWNSLLELGTKDELPAVLAGIGRLRPDLAEQLARHPALSGN